MSELLYVRGAVVQTDVPVEMILQIGTPIGKPIWIDEPAKRKPFRVSRRLKELRHNVSRCREYLIWD